MATLMQKCDVLVVITGDSFFVYRGSATQQFKLPEPPEPKEPNGAENDAEKKQKCVNEVTKNTILASAFSPSGKFFAIGDDRKQLFVYKVSTEASCELQSSRSLARRCTAIAFTHAETEIVVADRTGDVYRFPLDDENKEGEVVLGHLSMVLDLKLTADDKYIITSDRDEKVRISCYPNAYNIHAFCLTHTEYVSQVLCLDKFSCLVSGSGDGKLCTWDIEGHHYHSIQAVEVKESSEVEQDKVKGEGHQELTGVKQIVFNNDLNILAVLCSSLKKLSIYSVYQDDSKVKLKQEQEVPLIEEPWDVCFYGNRLVLLQPVEKRPLITFEVVKQEGGDVQVREDSDDDKLLALADSLKQGWNLFEEARARGQHHQFGVPLQKTVKTEYVDKYLEQKKERLRGQAVGQGDMEVPPEKKVKTS